MLFSENLIWLLSFTGFLFIVALYEPHVRFKFRIFKSTFWSSSRLKILSEIFQHLDFKSALAPLVNDIDLQEIAGFRLLISGSFLFHVSVDYHQKSDTLLILQNEFPWRSTISNRMKSRPQEFCLLFQIANPQISVMSCCYSSTNLIEYFKYLLVDLLCLYLLLWCEIASWTGSPVHMS